MSKVTMPEPVARATVCAYQGRRQFLLAELGTKAVCDLTWGEYDLITTDQAEAYAAAKVREALEQAIAICQVEGDEWDSDSVEIEKNYAHAARDRIRALIPPLPGPVEP